MSYSQRFLDRHAPQAEVTIAEPKLMDDDDEEELEEPQHSHAHCRRRASASQRAQGHPSHRRGTSRSGHHSAQSRSASTGAAVAESDAIRVKPLQPFDVLHSPHRRPPDATPPPQVPESRKVFSSPRVVHPIDVVGPTHTTTKATPAASPVHATAAPSTTSDAVDATTYVQVLNERNVALRLLDTFKTEGNNVIQRLHESLKAQQRENAELAAALAALQQSNNGVSRGSAAGRPHEGPGTTLRVIELEEKVMAQTHVIEELDKLMRSADTMLLAMRARCEAAEHRCRRLEEENRRDERRRRAGSPAASMSTTPVPHLDLEKVAGGVGVSEGHASPSSTSSPSVPRGVGTGAKSPAPASPTTAGLAGELLATRLREKYPADPDVEAAVCQWMATQAHLHALRLNLDEERRRRMEAEEVYTRSAAESDRSIQLLERRLHRAQTPRAMIYRDFDAELLNIPLELSPRAARTSVEGDAATVTAATTTTTTAVAVPSGRTKDGRTIITVTAREDGSHTPPSPIERSSDVMDFHRSSQSTPTKMLFTMGSETADTTRTGGVKGLAAMATRRTSTLTRSQGDDDDNDDDEQSNMYESVTVPVDASESTHADAREVRENKNNHVRNANDTDDNTDTQTSDTTKHRRRKKKKSKTGDDGGSNNNNNNDNESNNATSAALASVVGRTPITVAPPSAVPVERDLTKRRESSQPASPRTTEAVPLPVPLLNDAKPPLTPRSSAARKRFIGDHRPTGTANSSFSAAPGTPIIAHAQLPPEAKTEAVEKNTTAPRTVDIPVPDVLTSAVVSVRNASFASVASSRASSVGSRTGRLVNLRPRSQSPTNSELASHVREGGDKVEVSHAKVNNSDQNTASVPPRETETDVAASPEPTAVRRVSSGSNSRRRSSRHAPPPSTLPATHETSSASRTRSPQLSEARQRALSEGLEELEKLNVDMDRIVRSLTPSGRV